jgi:hypothetical protein
MVGMLFSIPVANMKLAITILLLLSATPHTTAHPE